MVQVSIKTIAERASVSPSTVSRALRNDPRISQETLIVVQTLAREMGYVPSQIARSLVLQRTFTLGVVVTTLADPYVGQVMAGLEAAAVAQSYSLLLVTSNGFPEQEVRAIETLRQHRVDAFLVVSSRAGDLYASLLRQMEQPLVLINSRRREEGSYAVGTDTAQGAQLATQHLLSLGHRRIAFVGGPPGGHSSAQRRSGYLSALAQAGLEVDHRLLLPGSGEAADGQRALPWLLDLEATGVVCYNDLTALGLLAAADAADIPVPQELSVVGMDNLPFGQLSSPRLTTVDQRAGELGRHAIQLAVAAMDDPGVADIVLESRLVVRASTGEVC